MPYSDGTFPSGSPVITINSITYKCNSFQVTKGANTTTITDEAGDVSGHLSYKADITGTAEVQFAASNTAEPTTAAANATTGVFVATIDNANANCFITSVTVNKPKDAPWTASLNWTRKIT